MKVLLYIVLAIALFVAGMALPAVVVGLAHATPNPPPHPDQGQVITTWNVTVTENGVDRNFDVKTLEPWPFMIDPVFAKGWGCEVRPLILQGHVRRRWATCTLSSGQEVSVRAECPDNRTGFDAKEFWIGDKVSVELACASGVAP